MADAVDGRTRRAEEAREQRRRQILDAALRVFAERGYHGAGVSALVAEAGVARGTFYLYFDSKESVFRELLDGLLATLRASVSGVDIRDPDTPVRDQLVGIVSDVLRTTESNRALTRIIFREAVGLDDATDALLNAFYDELYRYIEAALAIGEATGAVRAVADRSLEATCIVGSLRAVVQRYIVDADAPFDIEGVAAAVVDHSLLGLLPRGA